jgi:hypothetical protein
MLTDRWWSTYGTLALAAFSGYGYVVGVTAISRLSSALGVSTQDLGIGTRDYVTLAAIYGAAVAIALTLSIAFVISYATYAANMTRLRELVTQMGDKSDVLDHLPSHFRFTAFLGTGALSLSLLVIVAEVLAPGAFELHVERRVGILIPFLAFAIALGVWALAVVRAAIPALSQGTASHEFDKWWTVGRLRLVPPLLSGRIASIVVVVLAFAVPAMIATESADVWAKDLRAGSADGGPWALTLLLQPSSGRVDADDDCVIRVSPRVVISFGIADDHGISVVGDLERFVADDCKVSPAP